jgi:hypothetical protein
MSTVPQPVLGPAGFVAPDEATILSAVQADIDTAFGGGLDPGPSTPQGQLATSETAIIAEKDSMFLYYVSQTDPRYAQGRMQDALGYIYFMDRDPAEPTVVTCTCTGLSGTVIPTNAQATDASGNIYFCLAGATIPGGGSISLQFANVKTGPIPCLAGTLNRIYVAIPGWDTITNAADGILGRNVETAQAFEFRRKNSVALNAIGSLPSVYAAVFSAGTVPPSDVYATENTTSVPIVVGGVTLAAHSLYIAAVGGDNQSIGEAMWKKKAVGCDYNGNTTVTVTDSGSATNPYATPLPTYTVKFERPASHTIYFKVSIVNDPALPGNIADLIKAAVVATFTGTDGSAPERIGSTVYASKFYAAVLSTDPSVQIISIFVGTAPSPSSGLSVSNRIDQYPVTALGDIVVVLV